MHMMADKFATANSSLLWYLLVFLQHILYTYIRAYINWDNLWRSLQGRTFLFCSRLLVLVTFPHAPRVHANWVWCQMTHKKGKDVQRQHMSLECVKQNWPDQAIIMSLIFEWINCLLGGASWWLQRQTVSVSQVATYFDILTLDTKTGFTVYFC